MEKVEAAHAQYSAIGRKWAWHTVSYTLETFCPPRAIIWQPWRELKLHMPNTLTLGTDGAWQTALESWDSFSINKETTKHPNTITQMAFVLFRDIGIEEGAGDCIQLLKKLNGALL
ncbi:hypothetical protein AX17_002936 [Amanita inopinata Kibby_2008]|nr:hypothetical protein AX17_002936 [Amanita inopinata Kibby_2008]